MKKDTIFTLGTVGCVIMSIAYSVIAILGLINGKFPLGYEVEAFTTNKIGIVVLFLAAAADLITVIITQIVYNNFQKLPLISKGTTFTGMAFVALIFVFKQSLFPIALWLLGAAVSVAALSACSDIVKPSKETPKK